MILNFTQDRLLDNLVIQNNPLETCAILIGNKIDNKFVVDEIIPVENTESSTIRFNVQEEKLLEIYAYSERINRAVIGIFHSHPSEAYPSITDIQFMEINPVPWIIKSTITNQKRCFTLNEFTSSNKSKVVEIGISITKG